MNKLDISSKEKLLSELMQEWSKCEKCQLHKKITNKVFGVGLPSAKLMIIGIGPGEMEDKEGRPFVGPSGKMLEAVLTEAKVSLEDIYVSNLLLCRPFDILEGKEVNRDPLKNEALSCLERIQQEIYIVDPEVIVVLGKPTLLFLLNKNSDISSIRGNVLELTISPPGKPPVVYPVVLTWHPSFLLRNGSTLKGDSVDQAIKDFKKAYGISLKLNKLYSNMEVN